MGIIADLLEGLIEAVTNIAIVLMTFIFLLSPLLIIAWIIWLVSK
jgi:hypothetical protein